MPANIMLDNTMPENIKIESIAIFSKRISCYRCLLRLCKLRAERAHLRLKLTKTDHHAGVIEGSDLFLAECRCAATLITLRDEGAKHLTNLKLTETKSAIVLEIMYQNECSKLANKSAKVATLLSTLNGGTSIGAPVLWRQRKHVDDRRKRWREKVKDIEEWRKQRGICSLEEIAIRSRATISTLELFVAREKAVKCLERIEEEYGREYKANFKPEV